MAVFGIEDNIFRCKGCGDVFFEEVEVKSFATNNVKVQENTKTKAIRCVNCGKYHPISDEYDLIEQA